MADTVMVCYPTYVHKIDELQSRTQRLVIAVIILFILLAIVVIVFSFLAAFA